jgi:hypothetical protein
MTGFKLTNATAVIPEFDKKEGEIQSLVDLSTNKSVRMVYLPLQNSGTSGSFHFAEGAIGLVGEEGNVDEPFRVTYALIGAPSKPRIVNDFESIPSNFISNLTSGNGDEDGVSFNSYLD